MRTAVSPLLESLKEIRDSIDTMVLDLVKDNEEFVLNLQREQLQKGIDAKGNQIKPPYADSTIERKKKKGQPYNRVTWKDSGDLYRSFGINYNESEGTFIIRGNRFYREYLLKRYGNDVEGLTPESIERVQRKIEPRLNEIIQEKIKFA